jgi:hypothetical protein
LERLDVGAVGSLNVVESVERIETSGHYIVRWPSATKCLC